jgi:hypothetical protein
MAARYGKEMSNFEILELGNREICLVLQQLYMIKLTEGYGWY